jgi:solute:Na+ symporter, SSS family
MEVTLALRPIDWLIMIVYFAFVLGIGFVLKRHTKTSSDFFESGRSIPAWVCGLAFISANLGAQEVIGMAASGAKYGIATAQFYWIGAIPAMIFVGLFMMPFYYGSRARSVPEYLRLRFDEKTRALNAISFAAMTVFSSGVSMYAMAKLIVTLKLFDNMFAAIGLPNAWIFHFSIFLSAIIVLGYIFFGGLTSAIYNEVLQFFLIVAGFFPLVWLGLKDVGGWDGLKQSLDPKMTHTWVGMADPSTNLMGVEWFGMMMGLGFVLSFGYWCTDFLVVQRAMAADSMAAARRTPLIAAIPKMFFPFLVIMPGLIAISPSRSTHTSAAPTAIVQGEERREVPHLVPPKKNADGTIKMDKNGKPELDYDLVIPILLVYYFPPAILGLGLTALLASFMSGMAGNVTAFNTVWTYDIYQAYIRKDASDEHYLWMGRMATVFGIAFSMAAAYAATAFNNIMDLLQLVFAFVNAPLFATFLLGMFWRGATGNGAFFGLLSGTIAAAVHHGLTLPYGADVGFKGGWLVGEASRAMHTYPSEMAQNFWTAIYAWTTCFVITILISFVTKPRPDEELTGLVYALTERPKEHSLPFLQRPEALAIVVMLMAVILNLLFF